MLACTKIYDFYTYGYVNPYFLFVGMCSCVYIYIRYAMSGMDTLLTWSKLSYLRKIKIGHACPSNFINLSLLFAPQPDERLKRSSFGFGDS